MPLSLQFARGFPGPTDITPSELATLAQRYYDPTTGLCSYIQFHNDLMVAGAEGVGGTSLTIQVTSMAVSFYVREDKNEDKERVRGGRRKRMRKTNVLNIIFILIPLISIQLMDANIHI